MIQETATVRNMRRRTTRMSHEGDYWTKDEKKTLSSAFYDGMGITEMALKFQRTEPAIMQQIEQMDLYERAVHPVRRRKKKCVCLCSRCQVNQTLCPLRRQYDEEQERM